MGRSVKVDGSKPGNGPKAVEFAQIDKQGRVPRSVCNGGVA